MRDFLDRVCRIEESGHWWEDPVWESDNAITPPELKRVVPTLQSVFDDEWFRSSVDHPLRSAFLSGEVGMRLLSSLGQNLHVLEGLEDSRFSWLFKRLKEAQEFYGAAYELRVLAQIFASDPTAEPYPALPNGKRAEARIRRNGRSLVVEAKTLEPPSNDDVYALLQSDLLGQSARLNLEDRYWLEWELTDRGENFARDKLPRLEDELKREIEWIIKRVQTDSLGARGEISGGGLVRLKYYPKAEGRFHRGLGFPLSEGVGLNRLFRRLISSVRKQLITDEPTLLCVRLLGMWPWLSRSGLEHRMGKMSAVPTYIWVEHFMGPILACHPTVERPDPIEALLAIAIPIEKQA